ncbi:radical SAM protein [Actinomadura sp. NPDC047616]|uniref:radical SAM protein n=1 Tax=Actinomadura sp. NPDC047616 TaxID=3155914 RepID=UPI0033D6F593
MSIRTGWPLPHRVAAYGDEEQFRRARKEAGQWVFWEDRVELVLAGQYDAVKPLHVELSPTYLCNFSCPWCSCRSAREDWSDTDVFSHPRATPLTVMRENKIDHVLDHLAPDRIGIMWVGGEPTMNPLLYPAALKADRLGLPQCLFTNGSLLNRRRVDELFDANLVFVRVSLNAVSPDVHQLHHDYDPRKGYADRVLDNLRRLAEVRAQRRSPTLFGVSVVVDERNLPDLENTAEHLCRLVDEYGDGCVDYVIFRPAFPFYTAQLVINDDTVERFLRVVGPGAPWRRRLEDAGIDVVVPDDSGPDEADRADAPDAGHDDFGCLAAGWFGEVTPNGDMVVCSDRYGNPDYFIGNVAERGVGDIWNGPERRAVLDMVRTTNCFARQCPSNGRGYFFNRLFREIEHFRKEDRLHEVRVWIEELRTVLPRPTHSFFL